MDHGKSNAAHSQDCGQVGYPHEPKLSPALQSQIGKQLRVLYEGLGAEVVPEHLLEILSRLDRPPSGEDQ
jgi:hypothetical protein